MKMWAIILALAIGMALLPGFRDKAEITGKVVVTAVGVDVAEGKADSSGVRVSVQAVETMKTAGSLTEQEKNATEVYAVEGRSIAGSMQAFATQTGRGAYILHNKVVALGMEAAKTVPLPRLLDFFMRDHESRPTVNVVICRGKAEELVGMPSASYAIPAEQLATLLTEGERQGGCVRSTLLEVERALSGMADAVLPIVRVEGEEEKAMAVLDGAALFRNGVWVGELDASAIRGYLFIRNRLDSCIYVLDTDEGQVTAEIRSSKIKIGLTRTGQTVRYSLRAECGVEIREEYGNTPLDAARLRQIEERLESIIEGDLRAAVAGSVTAYGCDILGLGRLTMQKLPEVIRGVEEEWPEKLRQCGFDYGVSLTIDRSGMTAEEKVQSSI